MEVLFESFKIAISSLQANKLRTFLSMLGIIIGVGAVISIVSIGSGAQMEVTGQIAGLGSNVINIMPGGARMTGGQLTARTADNFTPELADYIHMLSPSVQNIIPQIQDSGAFTYRDVRVQATIIGTKPAFQEINLYNPSAGRFINQGDLETASQVVVLGSRLARNIFDGEDPLGKRVRLEINRRVLLLTVVGVMEERGGNFMGNFDTQAYIPFSTYTQKISSTQNISQFLAQARSADESREAVAQIDYFLSTYLEDEDNYMILSQEQILDVIHQVTRTLNIMLGGIAGISLLVGGIGIMNIMLVSVTERTREIGIRKALGAKKAHIMNQFLIEALTLSSLGGLVGTLLGWLGAFIIASFGGWALVVSPGSVALALGFSLLVGLFFGIYPAYKAANMDPVIALSYE